MSDLELKNNNNNSLICGELTLRRESEWEKQLYEGNQEFKLQMPNKQINKALGYASLEFREQVRDGYI